MRKNMKLSGIILVLVWILSVPGYTLDAYKNFKVAVYSRSYETKEMADLDWLKTRWDVVEKQVHVDKIYLETHRDLLIVDKDTILKAKKFFAERGVQTSGGITLTVSERNRFETFCYTNPEHRKKVQEIAEYTASLFDEIILDDFFFTNCKCDLCIAAKGNQSWTDYRLELMKNAAIDLIIKPAKKVNPNVQVIVKYPNWYEHFQGLGFNLEEQPELFDAVYTGTETRDPSSNQHLQQYEGYEIFRYFWNLKPGANKGGWVDTGGMMYADRYAEQLWLTMFAKAPEITLFDLRGTQAPLRENTRAAWQGQGTSFDYDEMLKPYSYKGETVTPSTVVRVAGYTFEKIDKTIGELGNPVAIKSYKPYHSTGEDFIQNYLGMIGIPMDIVPVFPTEEKNILLTETASFDPEIVEKIKGQLKAGKNVIITSGLLRALQGKGIEDIAEIRYTDRKAIVKEFKAGWGPNISSKVEMVIPQINYLTNDSWEEVSAMDETNGWPMLHSAKYSKGMLYVLTIPESFTDLYNLPQPVLSKIRQAVMGGFYVQIDAPAQVSLFAYDNNTFIVESFLPESVDVNILLDVKVNGLKSLDTNEAITGQEVRGFMGQPATQKTFKTTIKPHSFAVFRCE